MLLIWASIAPASRVQAQQEQPLIRLEPTADHPMRFRGEVFIEASHSSSKQRQNRANWFARGRYLLECTSDLMTNEAFERFTNGIDLDSVVRADNAGMKRLADVLRPFSTAKISKADHRVQKHSKHQQYVISFNKPERVVDVERALRTSGLGESLFLDDWVAPTGVPTDGVFDARASTRTLYATREDDEYYHHAQNARTRAWSLYSLNMPLAWEVTTGNSEVVVGLIDQMRTCDPSPTTTDVEERVTSEGTGNVRRIVSTTTAEYSGLQVNTGNGINKSTYPVKTGHGYNVLGTVLSRSNNGVTTGTPSGSAVGTCPDCSGVVFPLNPPPSFFPGDPCTTPSPNAIDGVRDNSLIYDIDQFDDFDLDFTNDSSGAMKRLDILNCSYVGGNGELHKRLLRNGVVVVAAAGNDFGIAPFDPAATIVLNLDPKLDTKVLAVGAISDGLQRDANCDEWKKPYVMRPVWKGAEQFMSGYVSSPGTNKFSPAAPLEREAEKRDAYIDVVAPGGNVWTLNESTSGHIDARGYGFCSGTSVSTGLVSGVAGLMLSVSPSMGIEMDAVTDLPRSIADGLSVQRRLYNVITFTARKLVDTDTSKPYVEQANDALRRTWAPRMGFGKVDAYRAVAHCIPHKGEYEYSSSLMLQFNNDVRNTRGLRLMHWGSHIKDGVDWKLSDGRGGSGADDGVVDVLEHGGRSLPGETHNNYGVTRLTGATGPLTVTVPDSSVLCIDGLVVSNEDDQLHSVVATAPHASICADGYLNGVELVGSLRIGSIVVEGQTAGSALRAQEASDIYGTVSQRQQGRIEVSGETASLQLRPGSIVRMSGEHGIEVSNGASLILDQASTIEGTSTQEVTIHDGATCTVLAGVEATVDATIHVLRGGHLLVQDSAIVFIRNLVVEPGGTVTIKGGSHVAFGNSQIRVNGHFICNGGDTENKRITLSARINENCRFGTRSHAYMSSRVKIRMTGHGNDWSSTSLVLRNTDVKNLGFTLLNTEAQPIVGCNFSMYGPARSVGNDVIWRAEPHIITAGLSDFPTDAPSTYYFLSVLKCTFTDSSGAVPVPKYIAPINRSQERYLFSGVTTVSYLRTDVTDCAFSYLSEAVGTLKTSYTTVNHCTIYDCDGGVRGDGTSPRICDNDVTNTEYPIMLYTCERGTHNDNRISNSRVAATIVNCSMQAFRGNDFREYWKAITVSGAIAALTNLRDDQPPYEIQSFGRNRFDVVNTVPFVNAPMNHPNPFMRRATPAGYAADVAQMTDLSVEAGGGFFLLKCGLNRMSEFATSHIASNLPLQQVIDFSVNNCRPNAAVRRLNIDVKGAPLNVDEVSDKACGPLPTDDWCSEQNWRDGREEIGISEQPKTQNPHTLRGSADVLHATEPLAISMAHADHLLRILQTKSPEFAAADSVVLMGLLGTTTQVIPGVYTAEIRNRGDVISRVLILITP